MNERFVTNNKYYPYAVNSLGIVKNLETGTIRKTPIGNHGYPIVSLKKGYSKSTCVLVHRMVAEILIPNIKNLPCVNHKDLDKTNNCVSNLEWVTYKQNSVHAALNGKMSHDNRVKGELCNLTLYSDSFVHSICKDLEDGARNIDISRKYNVAKDYAKSLKNGSVRRDITSQYNLTKYKKQSVSPETVMWVCEKLVAGWTCRQIIDKSDNPNVTKNLVKNIKRKSSYKTISDNYF